MIESFAPNQLILGSAVLFAAYLIRGITGFGSGLIAIPLLALMLPVSVVVPMIGLVDYIASVAHGVKHRNAINWKMIIPLLPFMLMGMIAAVYLFNHLDAGVLKKSLGVFIVIYAAYSLLAIRPHTHKSPFWSVPAGLLGGFVSTLFGTGGPFYVIYLQLKGAGKATFRATVATVFLIDGSGRIVTYGIGGIYTIDTLLLVLVSVPIMIIAMVAGGHIHTNISQQKFQKAIGLMLLGSGSALIFS